MNAVTPIRQSAYARANGQLTPFPDPRAVMAQVADILRPPSRMSVVEAAEQYRVMQEDTYSGKWKRTLAPSLVEPMNLSQSRRYTGLVFVGPARSSKTDSLILNRILYLMTCVPGRVLMVNMDQKTAGQYSRDEIDRMIRNCKALAARQERGRGSDNLYQKLFKGGGRLTIGWPVASTFAQKTERDVLITERDRMAESIDGEGDVFTLARRRVQIAGSLGMVIEESSPSKPIKKRDWSPTTIHEAPPTDGILADYNLGTRARRYWTCCECGHEFEPDFEHLDAPRDGDIFERSRAVTMICPESSCEITPARGDEMEQSGRWLHESRCGTKAVPIGDPDIRDTDVVSYWHKGVQAAFQTWPKIMQEYLQAVEHFEKTGSEDKLQTFWNTTNGRPYLSKAMAMEAELNAQDLKDRASFRPVGEVPADARFLTAQVDVQGDRFEVQVDAWGVGLQRWLVDRFSIMEPPEGAPQSIGDDGKRRRPIQPALYAEDWAALDTLLQRAWPVKGTDRALILKGVTIDRNGPPGATDKAYAFFRARRRSGRWFLNTGTGRLTAERVRLKPPHTRSNKYKRVARDVPIIEINTTLIKDEVCVSLLREGGGGGSYDLPSTMEHRYFEEFAAEYRTPQRWEKRNGGLRNECFDLAYYGKALVVMLGGEQIDWNKPPVWAAPVENNSFAVSLEGTVETSQTEVSPVMVPAPSKVPAMSRAAQLAAMARARVGAL